MDPGMSPRPAPIHLPRSAPARVLACGAFLKNTACLVEARQALVSAPHGDLSDPWACAALETTVAALVASAGGPIDAIAHDLHPDFHSTRVALEWAQRLRVPAIGIQHHHAHLAVVQAESGIEASTPFVGLALDGVGLGSDGTAWGGEVLLVRGPRFERSAHLSPLPLPGGDMAAREPWRLAAAALHRLGRGDEIVPRFGPLLGETPARLLHTMLQRGLNCPPSSGAGRWFDAASAALGLCLRQTTEAEAAIALERAATLWLEGRPPAAPADAPGERTVDGLDLLPLLGRLLDLHEPSNDDIGRAAAAFHHHLGDALVHAASLAARDAGATQVALGGGCFHNRLLGRHITLGLQAQGLAVLRPRQLDCGDAGLALGQAWAAALRVAATAATPTSTATAES